MNITTTLHKTKSTILAPFIDVAYNAKESNYEEWTYQMNDYFDIHGTITE